MCFITVLSCSSVWQLTLIPVFPDVTSDTASAPAIFANTSSTSDVIDSPGICLKYSEWALTGEGITVRGILNSGLMPIAAFADAAVLNSTSKLERGPEPLTRIRAMSPQPENDSCTDVRKNATSNITRTV